MRSRLTSRLGFVSAWGFFMASTALGLIAFGAIGKLFWRLLQLGWNLVP